MNYKSTKLFKSILLIVALVGFSFLHSFGQEYRDGVLQGTIRIKIKPTLSSAIKISKSSTTGVVTTGIQALDRLNATYSVTNMKRVFRYSPKFEERHIKYGLNLWYDVTIGVRASSTDAVRDYSKLQEVDRAEPILQKVINDGSTKPFYVSKADLGPNSNRSDYFNDPYLFKQWNYNNTGQSGGTPGDDINAYKAWNITKGSADVIVAIMDMGVDVNHEDLKGAMWVNEAEQNGTAGVDDDNNGYKDDINGFNFGKNMGTIDADYHATHVAGTIGAVNNNGIGVSGIAGGSGSADGVRLMSCEILGGTGDGNTPEAYVYAADMGAVISQNSWGYSDPNAYEQSVLDAIDYFIAEAGNYVGSPMKGGVVIFAAGNSNWNYPSYPGYYDPCISVAALNASDHRTVYSNYGTWVDIAAPGGQTEDNANLPSNSEFSNSILSTLQNNTYGYLDGTSMACPHVSGVAALIVSKFGGPNFTNTELKNRLLTGTRDIDTIPANQDYVGQLGSGAIDAALALATDGGIAPNKINDLNLEGIAQDFAQLNWSTPADNDDGKPTSFELLYSTSDITPATIQLAKSVSLNTRLEPGEKDSIEISSLKSLTKYYFAVISIDRWGNKSAISNVVSGTTNAGPDAEIDPAVSTLNITVDVSTNTVGSNSFDLINNGQGLLKWDATMHHVYAYPSSLKKINYPTTQATHYSNPGRIISSPVSKVAHPTTFSIDNPTYNEIGYVNPNAPNLYVVGENDTTYTNSSATRFQVTDPNGFNLTHVDAYLNVKQSTLPVIFEVYEGQDISDAKIVYQQEVSYTSDYGYTGIDLNEQLFFAQGKTFWVVFHVPAMNKYPLGAALETNSDDSKNCYYSSDLGKTWKMFEDVYYDNQLVWAVYAVSTYSNLGDYITLSPESGTVNSNDSTSITATVDGSNMINGNYAANIVVNTNQTGQPMLTLPVNLTITGHKPIIKTDSRIDFGSVLLGNEKEVDVTLQNTGLGLFQFNSYGYDSNWNYIYFQISNPQFSYVSGLNSWFESGTQQTVKFKLKPTQVGSISSTVQIQDTKGDTYTFQLIGVGVDPPVMVLSPSDTTIVGKAIGDTITGSFFLKNAGKYPLDYFFPSFADGSNMAEIPANIQKFGYISSVNPSGTEPSPAYSWTDISTTGTDVASYLTQAYTPYHQVDIGFPFPFFGKNETAVYISRFSTLSFDTNGYIWSSNPLRYQWEGLPDRIISVLGIENYVELGGHVYFQRFPDKFIVQWDNVSLEGMGLGTYEVVLHDNGNINIYIKSISAQGYYSIDNIASSTYIGIEDQTKNDGLRIHDYVVPDNALFSDGSAVEIVCPGEGLFSNLSSPFGTVQQGDSVKLSYKILTNNLNVANYTEKLSVITNDPVNNPGLYTANFDITSGGVPNVLLSNVALDYGSVFQHDTKVETISIADTGRAPVTIQSATIKHGYFNIDGTFPVVLKPHRMLYCNVTANSSTLGTYKDTLVFATDEGKTYEVELTSEIVTAPQISIDSTEIIDTIVAGSTKVVNIVVSNAGDRDLDVAPVGNPWMSIAEKATREVPTIPAYAYQFKSSNDEGGPEFSWVEIGDSAVNKVTIPGDIWVGDTTLWAKVDLPFAFNYYGTDYTSIYVGYNGIISFVNNQPLSPFGGPNIPSTDKPNNYIAPLYGFIGPDDHTYYPLSGHYCKVENDRVIVEFREFNSGFSMSGPMSIEAILYKDGKIKFQYKLANSSESDLITNLGTIGIENADGTDGVQISCNSGNNRNLLAYELFPVNKYVIPAGGSKAFEVTLNATDLFAGNYSDKLNFVNNAPLGQGLSIPVSLTVTGAPVINAPDTVNFGDVFVVGTPDQWGGTTYTSYDKNFVIENAGTAKAEITQFDVSKLTSSTVYAWVLAPDWFGNMSYQWVPVDNLPLFDWNTWLPIPLYLQPKSTMQYMAEIMPTAAGEVRDTLTVITDNGNIVIPINGNAVTPPAINVPDTVKVYAQTPAYTETKSVLFDNTAGGYNLNYSLAINFSLPKEAASTANAASSANRSAASLPLSIAKKFARPSRSNSASRTSFNRVLSYESDTAAETGLGYGGSSPFYSATALQAPADGFNLTHVQTWYVPESWLNSRITVQIYAGSSDINMATLVQSMTYDYSITNPSTTGALLTIPLDKNIVLYPNEYFFVVFGYELGAGHAQGVVTMPQITKNRYLYSDGSGTWYDITDGGSALESYGWIVRALEETYKSAVWVTLESASADTIGAGETGNVSLNFNAANANPGDNYADLVVTSNDPLHSKKIVKLLLEVNQGPKFNIDNTALSVNENDTISFQVAATDVEGDSFTMAMGSNPSFVKGTLVGDTMNITCTPTFDDAGIYNITVEGTDSFGNKSEASIMLTVKNVNRAPVVIDSIGNGGMASYDMPVISLPSIIADPDGDKLTYVVTASNDSVVKLFMSDDALILTALNPGTATLTITGTDPGGLSCSYSFDYTLWPTGIQENSVDNIRLFPNPTKGDITVFLAQPLKSGSVVKVTNLTGSILSETTLLGDSNQIKLDISNLVNGVYLVKIESDTFAKTLQVVKN